MNAKDKAKELVNKYLDINIHGLSTINATNRAKQCALITVEELINDCDASSPYEVQRLKYWNQVKEEIGNL